jgi:hypothetical protein
VLPSPPLLTHNLWARKLSVKRWLDSFGREEERIISWELDDGDTSIMFISI